MNNDSAELVEQYRQGDPEAANELFYRYWERLTQLARSHLSEKLHRRIDPEDIVLSAYRSFFVSVRDGRFTFQESGDLWRLLAQMTMNKLYRQAVHHTAKKRSIHQEQNLEQNETSLEDILDRQPTPEEAVALVDEVEQVLASLDETDRIVLEYRLEGATLSEISHAINRSEKTVSRTLTRIREQLDHQTLSTTKNKIVIPEINLDRSTPFSKNKQVKEISPQFNKNNAFYYSDFILQQLIGSGGVGKVYRAVHKKTGECFAIKFLKKKMLNNSHIIQRFLNEAQMIIHLEHPHLVGIKGLGETPNGGYFIVMDFIEGNNLAEIVEVETPSMTDIIRWVSEAASALHFMHQQGIIHCDMKPANILIDAQGVTKVTDFGFARSFTEDESHILSGIEGTAPFMAPEQIDSFWGKISPATDVYGLGAVLFTLLTRSPPCQAERITEIFSEIITGDINLLADRFPRDVSKSLRDICLRCLEKQSEHRFRTAQAFKEALEELTK